MPIGTEEDLSQEDRDVLKRVRDDKKLADDSRKPHVDQWNRFYGLHRNYRQLRQAHSTANAEADRDEVIEQGKREWGAELFIPFVYATVETVVPRALLNDPVMQIKPRNPNFTTDQAEAIKALYAERQAEIGYEMILQPTARRGFKYGLGAQKTFWNRKTREIMRLEPGIFGLGTVQRKRTEVIDEGPSAEDIDIFDLFWDPVAKNVDTCGFIIHRTWRNMRYVRQMIESGAWTRTYDQFDLSAIESSAPAQNRDSVWAERMKAAGVATGNTNSQQGKLHEVWEYHDGEMVHTVLDGKIVVRSIENPFYHRQLPFQIFRPTLQEGEFVGIGEIEPIAHLQAELNTLRSQRRDNATLVLQKAFIYSEGLVDPDDLVVGPGMGIPTMGAPSDVLQPLIFGEIPASGYQEEQALKADFELASGISEATAGAGGGDTSQDTATGVQLVQAAANVRIRLKTKNLEREMLRPAAAQWKELYRQFLTNPKDVRYDDPTSPTGVNFLQVKPKDVRADFDVIPAAGSTEPDNVPQKRNDALTLFNQVNGNQDVDGRRALLWLLQQFDIPDAELWLAPEAPQLDAQVVQELLLSTGTKPEQVTQFLQAAIQGTQQMQLPPGEQAAPAAPTNGGQPAAQGAAK
jgi:hypothetical protein